MKISSKSILSPSRARESSQISLSTSLSRRLKTSGSLKGGQASPMFPTGGKKRGCAFENPEPSSPKVTCIGQVRVKTKKQGKKMRAARSQKRRANSSEPSFRKSEQQQIQLQLNTNNDQQLVAKQYLHQNSINGGGGGGGGNQKWVHLPFTICEAVRAFGAELNCFLPCNSSCTNHKDKELKGERSPLPSSDNESSCGTVFGRWLVAVQDGDGKGREIELVVEDEEEKENQRRRHVFEGLDFEEKIKNELVEEEEEDKEKEEEEEDSRNSICVPPKNALLLMRCRSDPVKMAELAKRFCESSIPKVEEEDEEEEHEEEGATLEEAKIEVPVIVDKIEEEEEAEEEEKMVEVNEMVETEEEMREELVFDGEEEKEQVVVEDEKVNLILQEETDGNREIETGNEINEQQGDVFVNQNQEEEEEDEFAEEIMSILTSCCESESTPETEQLELTEEREEESIKLAGIKSEEDDEEQRKKEIEEDDDSDNGEKPTSDSLSVHEEQEKERNFEEEEEEQKATHEEEVKNEEELSLEQSKERETQERESSVLPDCLLLMMYEPKLSMEVSKETWVCSTDFIRCVPTREKKTLNEKINGRDPPKKRISVDRKPSEIQQPSIQPPRWSCSFPAPAAMGNGISMATMIEQKLVSAKGYEPLVLKRCKSEPMRSSAKVAQVQDACFWKDRKLEPHRPATFGVGIGAAGLGF